jgi:hypothetical protein
VRPIAEIITTVFKILTSISTLVARLRASTEFNRTRDSISRVLFFGSTPLCWALCPFRRMPSSAQTESFESDMASAFASHCRSRRMLGSLWSLRFRRSFQSPSIRGVMPRDGIGSLLNYSNNAPTTSWYVRLYVDLKSGKNINNINSIGGRGGIRTHGTLAGTPVFKTGALNHSATLPYQSDQRLSDTFSRTSWERFCYLGPKLALSA